MTAEYGDIQIDLPNVNYQKQPGRIQLSMTYVLWSGFSIFVFYKSKKFKFEFCRKIFDPILNFFIFLRFILEERSVQNFSEIQNW